MDFAQVLALIQAEIVANGNNEITANVLRPVLEAMLEQPNDLIGDLGDLETSDQSNLVAAINEIISTILPSINDGTKVIEVFRPFTEAGGGVSELQNVCNIVNAYNPFEIPANQVGVISFLQFAGGVFGTEFTKFMYLLKVGAGTYGLGETQLTPANLIKLAPIVSIPEPDFVYDLGNIGTTAVHTFVNGAGPYLVDGLTVFEAVQDGDDKIWLFVGGNGNYGDGATPVTASMFVDLGSQDPIPGDEVFEENVIGTLNVNNNVSGNVVLNWKNNTEWKYTLVGVTEFTSSNLPTNGTQLRTIWLTGEFAYTFPGGVTFRGDDYDGTKWNKITIHYVEPGFIDGIIEVTELMV